MSSFRWGGKTFRSGNKKAFAKHLRSRGTSFDDWAAQHPDEARETFSWRDPIDSRIQATLGPEIASIRGERQDRRQYYKDQQQRQKYVTQQLAEMLKSVAPGVQNLYGQARDASAALGRGFAGETGDILAAQAASDNSFLQNVVGAPRGQIDARSATAGGSGMEDVIYGLGYAPAQTMNEAGAAWAAQSAQLPYYAAQRGSAAIAELMKAASEEDRGFGRQISDLQSKRPELRMALEEDRAKQLEDRRRYEIDLKRQAASDARSEAALEAQLIALGIRTKGTKGLDAAGSPDPDHHIDPKSGKVVENGWHHVKRRGVWVPVKDKTPKDPKDLSGEAAKNQRRAVHDREEAVRAATEDIYADAKDLSTVDDSTVQGKLDALDGKKVPRSKVRKILINKYMRVLGSFTGPNGKGALRRRVTRIVDEALDSIYS